MTMMRCLLLSLPLAVLLVAGCADPVAPARDNYLDPDGTNYQNPGVEFLAGPSEGATITQDEVCFRWRGTGYATQFRHQLDDRGWSAWSATDSVRYAYLDDGDHQLLIYARTEIGVGSGPWPRLFAVDAAPFPGLIAVPWRNRAVVGGYTLVSVVKKGIGPVSKARFVVAYPPAAMVCTSVNPGSGWSVGAPLVTADSSNPGLGRVDVTYRLATPGAVTAGDGLLIMVFRATAALTSDSIVVGAASYLIDGGGDTVAAPVRRGGIISISQ